MRWFRFFFGTPQRLLMTAAGAVVVYAMISPGDVNARLNTAAGALFGPLATLAILVFVFWRITGGRRR